MKREMISLTKIGDPLIKFSNRGNYIPGSIRLTLTVVCVCCHGFARLAQCLNWFDSNARMRLEFRSCGRVTTTSVVFLLIHVVCVSVCVCVCVCTVCVYMPLLFR